MVNQENRPFDSENRPFDSRPFDSYGDVNGDGAITVTDAIIVLRHIVGLTDIADEYDELAILRAKVSNDGGETINVGDAILILRYIVGLIQSFPVESAA